MKSKRFYRGAATVAVAALVLAACGDNGDEGAEPTATGEIEDAEDTEDTEDADGGDDAADWPDELVMVAVPAEEAEGLEERFEGISLAIGEDVGLPVTFRQATDYAGVIEALIAGSAHVANMPPFAYVIATESGAQIRPAGAYVDRKGEEPAGSAVAVTLAENDHITSLDDLTEDMVACFTDPGSTTGYLYPAAELLEMGRDPETWFAETIFTGQHDAAVLSLLAGECDVAFTYENMVRLILPDEGVISDPPEDDLNFFWQTDVPPATLVVSTLLPEDLQDQIVQSLLDNDGETLLERGLCPDHAVISAEDSDHGEAYCALSSWGAYELTLIEDEAYDAVRLVCEQTGAPACDP